MKIQLVKESTGFGFNSVISNWAVEDQENLVLIEKIKSGAVVEITEKLAINFYNMVNVETGEMISRDFKISITKSALFQKYKSITEETKLKAEIKASFNPKMELKSRPKIKTIKTIKTIKK